MTLLLKIIRSNETKVLYLVLLSLIAVRIAVTDINYAEWGDSYRILRASEYITRLTYPDDEKRPPLFSALLAFYPKTFDHVQWSKYVMLSLTLVFITVFYKLSGFFFRDKRYQLVSTIFLLGNPVFFYWSLRIYADLLFGLLVLMGFFLFVKLRTSKLPESSTLKNGFIYPSAIGFICLLSILTRFEGYLFTLSMLVGLCTIKYPKKNLLIALIPLLILTPYFMIRNPLASSYFEETSGRSYDFTMFLTYITSYLFMLGIIPAFAYVIRYAVINYKKAIFYAPMSFFIILESILILVWPAALPRLFLPVIPFFVILFVKSLSISNFYKDKKLLLVLSALLTAVYAVFQWRLRLQFFGANQLVFYLIIAISTLSLLALHVKSKHAFSALSLLTCILMSGSVVYMHKDIYSSLRETANTLVLQNPGKVIHNDVAGIINWYASTSEGFSSEYKDYSNKTYLTNEYLLKERINYLVITNEHDVNLDIDLKKRPYLKLISASEHTLGGKMFHTWLVEVNK